jgi:hypothetical protein
MTPMLTGLAAEQMVVPLFDRIKDRYVVRHNWPIPPRPGCQSSRIEWMLFPNIGGKIGIEVQTQNRPGSAERRITDKIKTLSDLVKASNGEFAKFYVLIIGEGFRERERYLDPQFKASLNVGDEVEVVTLDMFTSRLLMCQA